VADRDRKLKIVLLQGRLGYREVNRTRAAVVTGTGDGGGRRAGVRVARVSQSVVCADDQSLAVKHNRNRRLDRGGGVNGGAELEAHVSVGNVGLAGELKDRQVEHYLLALRTSGNLGGKGHGFVLTIEQRTRHLAVIGNNARLVRRPRNRDILDAYQLVEQCRLDNSVQIRRNDERAQRRNARREVQVGSYAVHTVVGR